MLYPLKARALLLVMSIGLLIPAGLLQVAAQTNGKSFDDAATQNAAQMLKEGTVKKNKPVRVLRNSVVIFEGELESLRRFKDIVDEVKSGTECGIAVKAYNDVQPGDQIECFERIEVKRSL